MKFIPFIILISTFASGQNITKKQADSFSKKLVSTLKSNDSIAFINCFDINNEICSTKSHPLSKDSVFFFYKDLKNFLDSALNNNIEIKKVKIDGMLGFMRCDFGINCISVYFEYRKYYYKYFAIYVDKKGDNWYVVYPPFLSTWKGKVL